MSDENVEIVQRFIDQARDNPDAVCSIFDQDVRWELDPALGASDHQSRADPTG